MTHVTCRLTAKNRNPTLSNWVWATFFIVQCYSLSAAVLWALLVATTCTWNCLCLAHKDSVLVEPFSCILSVCGEKKRWQWQWLLGRVVGWWNCCCVYAVVVSWAVSDARTAGVSVQFVLGTSPPSSVSPRHSRCNSAANLQTALSPPPTTTLAAASPRLGQQPTLAASITTTQAGCR